MIIFSEKRVGNSLIWGILMLTVFYNIGAGACLLVNVNPAIFNFSYKIFGTLLTLYGLIGGLVLNSNRKFSTGLVCVLIFWAIYSIRLLFDIEILKVPFGFSKLEVYSFAFGGALNLTLAIIFCGKSIDIEKFVKIFRYVILAANLIIILLLLLKSSQIDIVTLFLRRSYFSTDSEDIAIINPITIAINGGLLLILSIIELWFRGDSDKRDSIFIVVLSVILGLVNLLLGGSRGPFLFLGLVVIILFWTKLIRNGFSLVFLLRMLSIFFVLAAVLLYFFGGMLTAGNFALFNRLSGLGEATDPSDAPRFMQLETAWGQFLNSPIIGDRFVERFSNFYPHNIILESLMATGIIGTTFFLAFVSMSIRSSFLLLKTSRTNSLLKLGMVNLFFLLACLTSGCIWNSLELWTFSILVIVQAANRPSPSPNLDFRRNSDLL